MINWISTLQILMTNMVRIEEYNTFFEIGKFILDNSHKIEILIISGDVTRVSKKVMTKESRKMHIELITSRQKCYRVLGFMTLNSS